MPGVFRWTAIMLAFVGIAGPGPASETADERLSEVALGPISPGAEITGSIERSLLSDEQRALVFVGVMNLPDMPDVDAAAPDPAAALPGTIALHDLPPMAIRRIPVLRGHKFVKLDDRILVVRPADRVVVSQLPRYRLPP